MGIIIDNIRLYQAEGRLPFATKPWTSEPEMLYIGCIEAKLDPIKQIGIPLGGAVIYRIMAALAGGLDEQGKPLYGNEAAVVQYAVNVKKVKDIVVSAHTHCGGLKACMDGCDKPETNYVHEYLKPLQHLWDKVMKLFKNPPERATALEEETVRKSIENLMTYPFVREAMKGGMQIHGWVLDIDNGKISEMDPETKKFELMGEKYAHLRAREHGPGTSPGR